MKLIPLTDCSEVCKLLMLISFDNQTNGWPNSINWPLSTAKGGMWWTGFVVSPFFLGASLRMLESLVNWSAAPNSFNSVEAGSLWNFNSISLPAFLFSASTSPTCKGDGVAVAKSKDGSVHRFMSWSEVWIERSGIRKIGLLWQSPKLAVSKDSCPDRRYG